MGTVYLARLVAAHGFSRLVALKSMHPHYALDPNFAALFVDEARITALLRHPNIVSTLDVIADGEQLKLVMEYVEGRSLWELFERSSRARTLSPVPVIAAVVHDLLMGLEHAHGAIGVDGIPLGIVHRDVSPQNVLVGRDGFARIVDFGIAKARGSMHATHTGAIRGKVAYMPPEQLRGGTLDGRVDVYAAGVVLWEQLTGRRLFEGEHLQVVSQILRGEVLPPSSIRSDIPPALDAVVMRAVSIRPEERFPTAAAMANAIQSVVPLASRARISEWVLGDATLVSADAAGFACGDSSPVALWSASSSVNGNVSVDSLSPSDHFTNEPPRSPRFALSIVTLSAICALGVVVGVQCGGAAMREARAAGTRSATSAVPSAATGTSAQSGGASSEKHDGPEAVAQVPAPAPAPAPASASASASSALSSSVAAMTVSSPATRGARPPRCVNPSLCPRPRPRSRPRFDSELGF